MIVGLSGKGRCDCCMKSNKEIVFTVSPTMIQGQICLKCYKKMEV